MTLLFAVGIGLASAADCDPAGLRKGVEAFGMVDREQLPALAAAAVGEACTWAPPIAKALEALSGGGAEFASMGDLQLAMADPAYLGAACKGKFGELAQLGTLAPAERRRFVFATCGVPFATEAEWLGGTGFLLTPLVMAAALPAKGADADAARAYARALAGIGPSRPGPALEPFRPPAP